MDLNFDLSGSNGPRMQFSTPGDELMGNMGYIQDLDEYEAAGHQGRLLRLAGCIDLESRVSVRTASVILQRQINI